jgi:hypothetical protein
MKKMFVFCAAFGFALISAKAMAEQSVTINGITYTCTNTCVVTVTDGNINAVDSNGGRVRARFPSVNQ